MNNEYRKIIHIDMDAFYASIEERNRPEISGKPVVIARPPDKSKRGVVATCNYIARQFGIHSAMPASTAYRKCPEAIFIAPRIGYYKEVSATIFKIYLQYTHLVEPLSLDEAFLDVTEHGSPSATLLAKEIKTEIFRQTQLTASAGISFTKHLAKIASDYQKPDGLTTISPPKAARFMDSLPIEKFFGVGKVTREQMNHLGIYYGLDLKKYSKGQLLKIFKARGERLYNQAHCIYDSPVNPHRIRKSMSKERTFEQDVSDRKTLLAHLHKIAKRLSLSLQKRDKLAKTIVLKVRNNTFQNRSKQHSLDIATNEPEEIYTVASYLLDKIVSENESIRLIGICAKFDDNSRVEQNSLEEYFGGDNLI